MAALSAPSSRVWMVVSAGPRSLGVFPLTFFPFPSPFVFLCTVDSFTLSSGKRTNFVLSSSANVSFFHSSNLPYPPTLMLPSRVVARVVSQPFCLRGLSPHCTSPSEDAFQGVDHPIGSFIADPSHGSPHTFGNHFIQKTQSHLYPYLPGRLQALAK